MKKSKLIKNKCEIETCNVTEEEALHFHHIIERTEVHTTNHPFNLAILCSNHHNFVHSGRLKIIGVYPSTNLPNKRILVYEMDNKRNIDLEIPHVHFTNKSFKIYGDKDE